MASRSAKGKNLPPSSTVMAKPSKKGEPETTFPGKDVIAESKERSKGFKRGGGIKSESVAAGTCMPGQRLDKPKRRASGGAVSMRGRSPLSAAASTDMPSAKTTH